MDDIRKTNRYSQEEKQAFIQEFKTAGLEQPGVNVTYISQQVTELGTRVCVKYRIS